MGFEERGREREKQRDIQTVARFQSVSECFAKHEGVTVSAFFVALRNIGLDCFEQLELGIRRTFGFYVESLPMDVEFGSRSSCLDWDHSAECFVYKLW